VSLLKLNLHRNPEQAWSSGTVQQAGSIYVDHRIIARSSVIKFSPTCRSVGIL
jgi:hypothetical protein